VYDIHFKNIQKGNEKDTIRYKVIDFLNKKGHDKLKAAINLPKDEYCLKDDNGAVMKDARHVLSALMSFGSKETNNSFMSLLSQNTNQNDNQLLGKDLVLLKGIINETLKEYNNYGENDEKAKDDARNKVNANYNDKITSGGLRPNDIIDKLLEVIEKTMDAWEKEHND
jgi:hypothetical protein